MILAIIAVVCLTLNSNSAGFALTPPPTPLPITALTTDTGSNCGGSLKGMTGEITSPGHPGNYPDNSNCTWTVTVPDGIIILSFQALDLECNYDYLTVFDADSGKQLARRCRSSKAIVLGSSNSVIINFESDGSNQRSGFNLTWSWCGAGGILKGMTGEITSPGYPGNYPANSNCTSWTVTVPDGIINLSFQAFNLECGYDYLTVFDADSGNQLARRCGSNNPAVAGTSNSVVINFKSDGSNQRSGFNLTWSSCGGILKGMTGEITSPRHPGNYPSNTNCRWTVTIPHGIIDLTFQGFDLECYDYLTVFDADSGKQLARRCGSSNATILGSSNSVVINFKSGGYGQRSGFNLTWSSCGAGGILKGMTGEITSPGHPGNYPNNSNCTYWTVTVPDDIIILSFPAFDLECYHDYLTVFDADSGKQLARRCGSNKATVLGSSNSVIINFKSDGSVQGRGFNLTWSSILTNSNCGGSLKGMTGEITSPGYPGYYPANSNCTWTVTVPEGGIGISFQAFDLECDYDYLTVFDSDSGNQLARRCGSSNEAVAGFTNSVVINFKSDGSDQRRGFNLTWSSCGGILKGMTGQITSPGHPGNYPDNTNCRWTVTIPDGIIVLSFQAFDLESGFDCLTVFDPDSGKQLARRCKSNNATILGSSNSVVINFRSDGSNQRSGFNLTWSSVLTTTTKSMMKITTSTPTLAFVTTTVGTTTAAKPTEPAETTTAGLWAIAGSSPISTTASHTGSSCGGTLKGMTGEITSPGHPSNYPSHTNCTWTVTIPHGIIGLTFGVFDLEQQSTCSYDYLMVFDASSGNQLAKICGSTNSIVLGTSNSVVINFKSDGSQERTGFKLTWLPILNTPCPNPTTVSTTPWTSTTELGTTKPELGTTTTLRGEATAEPATTTAEQWTTTASCGGTLEGITGEITSPGHPGNYPDNSKCTWRVATPHGIIVLSFRVFDLEDHQTCYYDYLKVFDAYSGNQLAKMCGSVMQQSSNATVVGISNSVVINFKSDTSYQGRGFKLTWSSTAMVLECPENIKLLLPYDSTTVHTTIPQPDISGKPLLCLSCPSQNQSLPEGIHNVNFIYLYNLTNETVSCSYQIEVIKPAPVCKNETKHLYLRSNQTMTKQMELGQCKLRLTTGLTQYKTFDGCYQNYVVHEWNPLERRAFLEAEYQFGCESLSKLSNSVIDSNARLHTKYLKHLCPECRVEGSPEISCSDGKLVITWKTDITANQQVQMFDRTSKLETHVREFESKYPEIDLTVIRTTPRIASPVRQRSGLYLNVVVKTICQDEGYSYNEKSDICENRSVDPAELLCPTNMKLTLPYNIDQLNITIPQPQIDITRMSCVDCPNLVQTLDEGIHNMTFSYMDKTYNQTIGCSYLITVIEQPAPACHNDTKRLFLEPNQSRTDEIMVGENGAVIRLDVGEYEVKTRAGCSITYIVVDTGAIKRHLKLQAHYPMKCQSLNKISLSILESYLKQHTQYIRKYCPVCLIDGSPLPLIQCNNDILIVTWNTGITENHQAPSVDIRNKLHTALVQFQNKYHVMDVTIITTVPRTVSPIKDSHGLNLRVVTENICADKFQYDKQYDVCIRAGQ